MDYNDYNNNTGTPYQGESNNQMFEGGGFESFGDNSFDSGVMPPIQTPPAYVPSQSSGNMVVKILIGVLAVLVIAGGIGFAMLRPYLKAYHLAKRTESETYTMDLTMKLSGSSADILNSNGYGDIGLKCVKGERIMSLAQSTAEGKMMDIYIDLQDPNNLVIDVKPLFEMLAKNLGSFGVDFDTIAKSSDSLAFSAEQLAEVTGLTDALNLDQLQGYNNSMSQYANFKTLRKIVKYEKNADSSCKVLGDDAFYFSIDVAKMVEEYSQDEVPMDVSQVDFAYFAVDDNNRSAMIVSSGGLITAMVSKYSFGPVQEPVMPDVSGNEKILNYLKSLFMQ